MSIKQITPALAFAGTAEQAIHLYEKALSAKVESLMRFGDAAAMGQSIPDEHRNGVMHSVLRIGEGPIMVMDAPPGTPLSTDGQVQVALDFDDVAEMTRSFDALAAGGAVTMPLQDAFWGARFGMLTDAFGIRWMFNCQTKQA